MHMWGDEWFEEHGDKLYAAQNYMYNYVKKWSRCTLLSKEKYGTIRYEWILPPGASLMNVKSIKIPYFKKKMVFNKSNKQIVMYGSYFLFRWDVTNYFFRLWTRLGMYTLKKAIYKACDQWPEIRKEILADAGFLKEKNSCL